MIIHARNGHYYQCSLFFNKDLYAPYWNINSCLNGWMGYDIIIISAQTLYIQQQNTFFCHNFLCSFRCTNPTHTSTQYTYKAVLLRILQYVNDSFHRTLNQKVPPFLWWILLSSVIQTSISTIFFVAYAIFSLYTTTMISHISNFSWDNDTTMHRSNTRDMGRRIYQKYTHDMKMKQDEQKWKRQKIWWNSYYACYVPLAYL